MDELFAKRKAALSAWAATAYNEADRAIKAMCRPALRVTNYITAALAMFVILALASSILGVS